MDDNSKFLGAQSIGMPWFVREDYDAFRKLLPGRAWHATFDQWQEAAEQALRKIEHERGLRVVKAEVRSDAFAQWCRISGRNVDSAALLLGYANEFAARQFLDHKSH